MTTDETQDPGGGTIIGAARAMLGHTAASDELDAEFVRYNSVRSAVAMLVVSLAAGAAVAILPGVLSAFVLAGEITSAQSSRVGAFELAGITLSMLGYGIVLSQFDRRRVAIFAIAAIAAAQLFCLWPRSIEILLAARLFAGLSEGVLIALVTATIGGLALPERVFALWFSLCLLVSAAFYAALPLLMSLGQMKGVMFALTGLAAVSAAALPWFPRRAPPSPAAPTGTQQAGNDRGRIMPAVLAMSASLVLFSGIGAVWPLMAQIGQSNDVDVGTVAGALSAASFAGVASGLIASWLGLRLGRTIPIIAGTLGLFVAIVLLFLTGGLVFVFSVILFMTWWIFNSTYYLGVVSALDPSGRLATFTFALQFMGLTLGQIISAIILRSSSYHTIITSGASFSLGALLLMMMAMRIARVSKSGTEASERS